LLTNVFYTAHYKLYMRTPAPELVPVDESNEGRNGAAEKPKPSGGYQPPKKRSKRK
jgi:hypothetical protein